MKKFKNEEIVQKLFNPDKKGFSRIVQVSEFKGTSINWGNNGHTRQGRPPKLDPHHIYNWNYIRKNPDNKTTEILALQMVGFRNGKTAIKNSISSKIKKYFINTEICNFSLLPLNKSNREIDHRWGYKEHKKYTYMQNILSQSVSDFQVIHRNLNLIKREICKKCRNDGIRPRHPEKRFVVGTEKLDDVNVCEGCYLAQPERYR